MLTTYPHMYIQLDNIYSIIYNWVPVMYQASNWCNHFGDFIMGSMASQITRVSIIYSTVCWGSDQRKKSKLSVTGLCDGNSPVTGEFPAQRASNAWNISIWWRHHERLALKRFYPERFIVGQDYITISPLIFPVEKQFTTALYRHILIIVHLCGFSQVRLV